MKIKEIKDDVQLEQILHIVESLKFNAINYVDFMEDGMDSCEYSRRILGRILELARDLKGMVKED